LRNALTQDGFLGFGVAQPLDPLQRDRHVLRVFAQKGYAGLIGAAPHHTCPVRPLLLRDGQIELIGNDSGVGQRHFGARRRDIAHVTIHGGAAFIECNDATEIGARAYGLSSFKHAATPFPFGGRE
jgi:hypothetical protein